MGEGIPNFKIAGIVKANDIAGVGLFNYRLILCHKAGGIAKSELLVESHMMVEGIAGEDAGNDAQKSNAVAVSGVKVGVYFKNESGEMVLIGMDKSFGRLSP